MILWGIFRSCCLSVTDILRGAGEWGEDLIGSWELRKGEGCCVRRTARAKGKFHWLKCKSPPLTKADVPLRSAVQSSPCGKCGKCNRQTGGNTNVYFPHFLPFPCWQWGYFVVRYNQAKQPPTIHPMSPVVNRYTENRQGCKAEKVSLDNVPNLWYSVKHKDTPP